VAKLVRRYSFGVIEVDGKVYRQDVVITPSRIIEGWWRREGHAVCLEDLVKYRVLEEDFEAIVFGTGYYGMVKVEEEVVEEMRRRGAAVYAMKTEEAVKLYNELAGRGVKVVGAFHLTC